MSKLDPGVGLRIGLLRFRNGQQAKRLLLVMQLKRIVLLERRWHPS
jgi:hypothetical protein